MLEPRRHGAFRQLESGSGSVALLDRRHHVWRLARAGSFTNHCKLSLRVEPEDEPAFEVTIHHEFREARGEAVLVEGWKVGVIYDPADHSKVVLDQSKKHIRPGLTNVEADKSQTRRDTLIALAGDPAAMRQYIRQAKATGAAQGAAPAQRLDTADELTKLADLRDRSVLTQAEFDAQKAKILGGTE
jgi:hypothetical protein